MTIVTRPLHPAGAPVAAALHATAGLPESWDETAFRELLETPGVEGCLAIDGATRTPVGLVLWRVAADEAEILTICVAPARRRGGIGRLLLNAAIAAARARETVRMALEVAVDNKAAAALYDRLGFRPAGRRRGYYRTAAGPVDAAILVREPL